MAGEAPATLNMVSLVLFALGCVAVLVIGLTAATTPRIAQLAFLIVAIFLLTNKVWSPQYSLWLVPLAVLAVPRVKVLLPWMAFDALLWIAHMSYFHGVANKGIDPELFHVLVLARNLLVVAVCVVVIVEIYRPDLDMVRRSHAGDPAGTDPLAGVLADPREPLVTGLARRRDASGDARDRAARDGAARDGDARESATAPPAGAGPADAPAAATPTATGAAAIDNDDGPLDYVADHEENPTR